MPGPRSKLPPAGPASMCWSTAPGSPWPGRSRSLAAPRCSATKYAVEALSDALRQEVAGFGIKVVIIEPGFVATNIGEAADANAGTGQQIPPAYADMAARGSRYLAAQIAKGIAAEQVAATIVKAAGQPNPRLRYVVPAGARPLIALLTSLPGRLADRAKKRALAAA